MLCLDNIQVTRARFVHQHEKKILTIQQTTTNTLPFNDTVERVSNYTGLDDCSFFTGLFYRENNKIGPKSRSVFGFDRLRFIQGF